MGSMSNRMIDYDTLAVDLIEMGVDRVTFHADAPGVRPLMLASRSVIGREPISYQAPIGRLTVHAQAWIGDTHVYSWPTRVLHGHDVYTVSFDPAPVPNTSTPEPEPYRPAPELAVVDAARALVEKVDPIPGSWKDTAFQALDEAEETPDLWDALVRQVHALEGEQ